MKATFKDIIPGKILYYVQCIGAKCAEEAKLVAKVIVSSHPNKNNNIEEWWFQCVDDYVPYGYDWTHEGTHHFLKDCGIAENGEYSHNLHRLFTSEESALAYVEECKIGKFSSPVDQDQYERDLTRSPLFTGDWLDDFNDFAHWSDEDYLIMLDKVKEILHLDSF